MGASGLVISSILWSWVDQLWAAWSAMIARGLDHADWPLVLILTALAAAVRDRGAAVIATTLAAFGLFDVRTVFAALLLGQAIGAASCFIRARWLHAHRRHPRLIGEAESARTPRGWRCLLFRRPLRTAVATRFVPGEHTLAFMAAGFCNRPALAFFAASLVSWTLWAGFYIGATLAFVAMIVRPLEEWFGLPGLALGLGLTLYAPRALALTLTPHGRRRLRTRLWRASHREYWPTSVLYAPLVPYLAYLSARRRGPMVFTCCNPGIESGGGIIGESKHAILAALADSAGDAMLPGALVPEDDDPARRAKTALDILARTPGLKGFPVVLKPDMGFRGYAFKLCRNPHDVAEYLRHMTGPAIMQAYHPGPHECGVMWSRDPRGPRTGRAGFIFSITRKDFPFLVGDGARTLEDLIYAHPRYHAQAATFLQRFAGQRERILAKGETLRLAESGNHCQGTLFRDGSDLITPALESAIDAIARGFRPPTASGNSDAGPLLDIGRFDLRYESDEALRQGRGFAIIEFNGTAGESTNIYDPERSIFWTYKVLAGQWRLMYELGAARRKQGARPVSLLEVVRAARAHYRTRTGSALAD